MLVKLIQTCNHSLGLLLSWMLQSILDVSVPASMTSKGRISAETQLQFKQLHLLITDPKPTVPSDSMLL